ncbi:hypothetical protein QFC21_007084 [Naganishia friedmannii]|uniref:Uncharacterized protein n=1 Tax=Naganishia friedmannii TaxID=89922 RepID=A0ACC2UZ81_9TREE|nr:hypothetical protein QFC21_007084 [Naganishia friedmannii]
MDVSADLAFHAAKFNVASNGQNPDEFISVDTGILTAFDEAPTEEEEYGHDLESYLLNRSKIATTQLFASLLALPTTSSEMGPIAHLPPSTTRLPREKPLPKPKPETRWEKFARMKGISHSKKEKNVWDDDRQMFVPRWGRDGQNKDTEEAWIRVIKPGKEDEDPILAARNERKDRVAKNKRSQSRNEAEATAKLAIGSASVTAANAAKAAAQTGSQVSQAAKKQLRDARKQELERNLLVSKGATASMGKFDEKVEGEPKAKGVKRKFAPTAPTTHAGEKDSQLQILNSLGTAATKRAKIARPKEGIEGDVNARKAVRFNERMERKTGGAGGGRGGARGGRGGGRGGSSSRGSRGGRGGKK